MGVGSIILMCCMIGVVQIGVEIAKSIVRGKLAQRTTSQIIDTAAGSFIKAMVTSRKGGKDDV